MVYKDDERAKTTDETLDHLILGRVLEPINASDSSVHFGVYRHLTTQIDFVLVPAGSFLMGGETEHSDEDESPRRRVQIASDFLFANTPCTQSQWQLGCALKSMASEISDLAERAQFPVFGDGENKPIYHVSWEECMKWCQSNSFDLPTEAEWEYVCRSGSESEFSFGNVSLRDHDELRAHMYYSESGVIESPDVAQKRPNEWGFYDFHGTIWEWCKDFYADDFYSHHSCENIDPINLTSGGKRVHRGGAWDVPAICCRSSARYRDHERYCHGSIGFRPVLRL